MNDPLILDTNVFRNRDFLHKLEKHHGRKILPAVAYAEMCVYYLGKKNKSPKYVDTFLNKLDIEVDWLDQRRARDAAMYCIDSGGNFSENARDYLIGAHAYPPPRTMITYNKDHFLFLGKRVYTPDEILKKM